MSSSEGDLARVQGATSVFNQTSEAYLDNARIRRQKGTIYLLDTRYVYKILALPPATWEPEIRRDEILKGKIGAVRFLDGDFEVWMSPGFRHLSCDLKGDKRPSNYQE